MSDATTFVPVPLRKAMAARSAGEVTRGKAVRESAASLDDIYAVEIQRLVGLGTVLAGDGAAGEDLTHGAFLRLAARMSRDPGYLHGPAWPLLRTMVVRLALQRRRAWARELRRLARAWQPSPSEGWEPSDTTLDWHTALQSLPPRMRATVVLFYGEDLSTAQTAAALGEVTTGVSCAGQSLCVSVDQSDRLGFVVISTSFNGGPAQRYVWPALDRQVAFAGISCPARTLCVAVGAFSPYGKLAGMVLTSRLGSPAFLPNVWTPTGVDSSALTGISCPAVKLCVATDAIGNIITSTNPSGGIGAWHVTNLIGTNSFTAISCPTVHFRAAVDGNGQVVTSTDPTGGPDAWTTTTLDSSMRFDSVSCATAGFCVVGGLLDSVFVTHDPQGGAGAWTRTRVIPRGTEAMTGLSCLNNGFCVGVDGGHVYTNPSR